MNLQEITDKHKELCTAANTIKEEQKALITPMFQAIFDTYQDINYIRIRGFTPNFNDGDPCHHITREPEFNPKKESQGGEYKESWYPVANILYQFESTLEDAYDTNWELKIKREADGSISIKEDEYYCGY